MRPYILYIEQPTCDMRITIVFISSNKMTQPLYKKRKVVKPHKLYLLIYLALKRIHQHKKRLLI